MSFGAQLFKRGLSLLNSTIKLTPESLLNDEVSNRSTGLNRGVGNVGDGEH